MNHPDDQFRDLANTLRRGTTTEVPTAGLAAVRRRGQVRRNRGRAAAGAACVVAVAAGAITVQRLSHVDHQRTIGTATDPTAGTDSSTANTSAVAPVGSTIPGPPLTAPADPTAIPVQRIEPQYVWNLVRPGTAEAVSSSWNLAGAPSGGAPYLMWSTAPGADPTGANFKITMYRSDDGIHWTASGTGGFADVEMSHRGLGTLDGKLLAFGTAAATASIPEGGAGDAVVQVSDDNGASWSPVVLPVDLRSLAATPGVRSVGMNGGLAVHGSTAVVVVEVEPIWTAQESQNLTITPNGVVDTQYPASPANTTPIASGLLPLSQFDIDPATVAARQTPRAFASTDGAQFTEVSFPTLPDDVIPDGVGMQVIGTAAGFYAVLNGLTINGVYSKYVFHSADGSAWTQMATTQVQISGVLDDGTLVGQEWSATNGGRVLLSRDGSNWQSYDLSPLLDPSDGTVVSMNALLTVGPDGITAVATLTNDPIAEAGGLRLVKDGVRAELLSTNDAIKFYDDATGAELQIQPEDDGGATVLDANDGHAITTFSVMEIKQLGTSSIAGVQSAALLHSSDGIHWSRENLADLTGSTNTSAGFVRLIGDTVVVTVVDNANRVNNVPQTLVLVGTPK